MSINKKGFPKVRRILIAAALFAIAIILGISAWTTYTTKDRIATQLTSREDVLSTEEIEELKALDAQCIMVLGAAVYNDGTPSPMLKDRLDTGIALYEAKVAPKLLLTGDNGQEEYNEVDPMLRYALKAGVPKEDIFLDHAGFSTYESVYRAGYIFGVKRMIVVTQTYHLYRALYGCRQMGIDALGAASDQEKYVGRQMRELREVLARDKDWAKWMIKPDPTYLGEEIPIGGDGTQTQE